MTIQIVNYRAVRLNVFNHLSEALTGDMPKLADAIRYVFGLLELTVNLNGPRAEDKAPRRQAKAHAWGAVLKGLGADVDVPDEASLNALSLAVETHLVPHLKGYEVYGGVTAELPGWIALGATPFAPDTGDVTH